MFPAAQLADIAQQDHRTDPLPRLGQRNRAQRHGARAGGHIGAPGGAAHRHHGQSLVDRCLIPQHIGHHRGQLLADHLARVPEPMDGTHGVGAGIQNRAVDAQMNHAVTHAGGPATQSGGSAGRWPFTRRDHPNQRGRQPLIAQLESAGGAQGRQVGMTGQDRERLLADAYRDRLLADRVVVIQQGAAASKDRALGQGAIQQSRTVAERLLPGVGPHMRHRTPLAAPHPHPQHEVGEGEVREQLPVAEQQMQMLDLGLGERRLAVQLFGEEAGHEQAA